MAEELAVVGCGRGGERIVDGGGIFRFCDERGLALEDACEILGRHGCGFDVPRYVRAALKAGWKGKTIKGRLMDGVRDRLSGEVFEKVERLTEAVIVREIVAKEAGDGIRR